IAIEHWGRETTLPTIDDPLGLGFFDLTFRRGVDREHHPHLTRIEILFTVLQDRGIAVNDDTRVQAALADFVFPNWLASLRFDGVYNSVNTTLNSKHSAIYVTHD